MTTETKQQSRRAKSKLGLKQSGVEKVAQEEAGRISQREYDAKYDLDDPEVFKAQADQLGIFEDLVSMQMVMLRLTDSKNPAELWDKMAIWSQEGFYFKEHLKAKVKE